MSGQTWTPAPKKSVIPLHPMTFGTILGRAFAALRHNPKVLFGFAVAVQFGITALSAVVFILLFGFSAVRIASVRPGSPDLGPIIAGSVALGVIVAILLTLAGAAFTAVVQGLVAADVSFAALGRKPTLKVLWRQRVRPAFWRLFAFALLQGAAVLLWILALLGIVLGLMAASDFDGAGVGFAVLAGVLLVLGSIPLLVWLGIKLLVVPAALVLERATIRSALVRSWRLIRGRFWSAFGVMFLIGAIMGIAAQVVAVPGSLISSVLGGTLAPTGDIAPSEIITRLAAVILPQILVLAVQAITLVVQGTGATLIYLDSRMRYEGLDQTLISHVERSALGAADEDLGDPYAVDPARAVSATPPVVQNMPPAPTYSAYPYAQPGQQPYPGQPVHQGQPAYPGQPTYQGQPPYPAQAPYPAYQGQPPHAAQPPYQAQPPYPVPQGQPTYPARPAYPAPPVPQGQPPHQTQPPQADPLQSDPPQSDPAAPQNPWAPPGGSA